jgi:diacylglycerol kinase (ATP)
MAWSRLAWRRPKLESGRVLPLKQENRVAASARKRAASVQIVINPRAGQGRGLDLVQPLLAGLRFRGYRPSVLVTEDRDHARRWAKECRRPPEYLICLSGDDTLDDLADVAIQHQIPIISAPLGFGNVFPQAFSHRAEVPAILDLLESGRRVNIDVGLWQGGSGASRNFLAVTIYGFIETIKAMGEARVDRDGDLRRVLGYLMATAQWLSWRQMLPAVAIEVDGETLAEGAALAVIANLPVFPGKLVFSRDADPRDGLLDVCVFMGDTKRALLASLCALLVGREPGEHRLLRRKGRVIRIRPPAAGAHALELDGGLETLTLLPRALPVLMPPVDAPWSEAR